MVCQLLWKIPFYFFLEEEANLIWFLPDTMFVLASWLKNLDLVKSMFLSFICGLVWIYKQNFIYALTLITLLWHNIWKYLTRQTFFFILSPLYDGLYLTNIISIRWTLFDIIPVIWRTLNQHNVWHGRRIFI